ncbi:hypothetical protein VTN77DRAFT_4975 [Rasamsonia byssochlamydoides]|uniref:uncharacterized protein n=1 Tax=Rasamsonia byssochlamydoides TaxID=89139 RepID=UPI003742980C
MDAEQRSAPTERIKRIRQACTNCRQKKTKCSGERPTCSHCQRNNRPCHYEPYSATVGDHHSMSFVSSFNNSELLQRLRTIESKLAELSGQAPQETRGVAIESSASPEETSPSHNFTATPSAGSKRVRRATLSDLEDSREDPNVVSYKTLPPQPVLNSLVDTYFLHAHNQPYSYFQEASFRYKLEKGLLPKCLVLAVLALALRWSDHEYYQGRVHEAAAAYAREAWLSVLQDHLTVEDIPNLHLAQTTNLLAIVDFTAGRISSGWLKIGLAVRISQDLHLMKEPSEWLSYVEQEERRRVFWSVYLLDKLVSCGRARPPALSDEDCHVQLPCDEHTFREGGREKTPTLSQLLNWNADVRSIPGNFTLTILAASILGRCARYVLHERNVDEIPPWDSRSEFASINSSLLLVESYSQIGSRSISEMISENLTPEGNIDHQSVGHLIFAHTVFHLCHCLLNHPFLLRLRLRRLGSKTPGSFSSRAFQVGCEHATKLTNLLEEAIHSGCHVEASFYAYATTIAGGVHSLNFHSERSRGGHGSGILKHFQQSLNILEKMSGMWNHASNMMLRLRDFHSQGYKFARLLDPYYIVHDLDPTTEEILWSMVDYGTMSDVKMKLAMTGSSIPDTPFAPSLGVNFGFASETPSSMMAPENDIFQTMMSGVGLHEVDYLMDMTSNGKSL